MVLGDKSSQFSNQINNTLLLLNVQTQDLPYTKTVITK